MHSRKTNKKNIHTNLDSKDIPKRIHLSANDKLNYLLRNGTDQQINYIFEFNDFLDFNKLKLSVRFSIDIEPVLGCNLIKKSGNAFWERRIDLDNDLYCKLIETGNIEEEKKAFILGQIKPETDPIIQIRIFRENTDTMIIKSDHSVMDGGGFYDYLQLLTKIYNTDEDQFMNKFNPNFASNRSLKQVLKKFSFKEKIQSFIKEGSFKPTWSFPAHGQGDGKRNYIMKTFDEKTFLKIKKYGKKINATINDMMICSFFRALFKINKPSIGEKMRVAIPTDLRVLLKDRKAETIANLVSATFVTLSYNPSESFDETLIKISEIMKQKKESFLGLGYMFLIHNIFRVKFSILEKFVKLIYKRQGRKQKMHPILTNVGKIDLYTEKFGELEIKNAYIITPVNWYPSFSMGISSFKNKLRIVTGFSEESYSKELIHDFFYLIEKEFTNII